MPELSDEEEELTEEQAARYAALHGCEFWSDERGMKSQYRGYYYFLSHPTNHQSAWVDNRAGSRGITLELLRSALQRVQSCHLDARACGRWREFKENSYTRRIEV